MKQKFPREEARQGSRRDRNQLGVEKKTEQWGSAMSPVGQWSFYEG